MAVASAWSKPGAWALDVEEHEAALLQDKTNPGNAAGSVPSFDFPTLAAATASKAPKKKKAQPVSLAEFTTGKPVSHGAGSRFAPKGLIPDELLVLPTGPRERSAEELERSSSRGFGYPTYNGGGGGRTSGEDSSSRWGSSRASDEPRRSGSNRDIAPSRADDVDDWGAVKKPMVLERRERSGCFFDSQSRADESDSWISNKSTVPRSNDRGFDAPRERRGGFETFNKEGPDSEVWGKKREEVSSGGRPRLVLQPRSLPLANACNGEQQPLSAGNSKGLSPFGQARPREEVLAEKGEDWKKIDEKLEAMKIWELPPDKTSFGKKGSGMGNGNGNLPEDQTERTWRKADTVQRPPTSSENVEEGVPET
ncbi:eukaryotic translation initiation factor 4B3 isoform X1 [Typha latifolia]|uniref:eukaryotic translation initiation factor 4B3 isoform X1 n=1 Tax=Typha latifolia TaxID=4733 RepID=UPI003C2F865D